MMNPKIGDLIQFETISLDEIQEGIVENVMPIKSDNFEGAVIDINVKDYGPAKVVFGSEIVTKGIIDYRSSRSGIPSQFAGVRWNDFKWSFYGENMRESRAFKMVRKFISDNNFFRERNKGLYIYGKETGCGKTMLACMLANEIIHEHIFSVRYTEQNQYLDFVRSEEPAAKTEAKAIRDCILLFIDDFGTCNTAWQRETIFRLIEYRQRQGHITVYVSSYPPEQVRLDDTGRANDLINASSIGVMLPGVSIRAKLAAQETKEFERKLFDGHK